MSNTNDDATTTHHELRADHCPRCGEVVNGQHCRNCGLNVETADTVVCHRCRKRILKGSAQREQMRSEYGGIKRRWVCETGCA